MGRLDQKTTGALLITDDVGLVAWGTSQIVEKIYDARCMGQITNKQLDLLRGGVDLKGGLGVSDPCEVELIANEVSVTWWKLHYTNEQPNLQLK